MPTLVSLFSGGGLADLGARAAGFDPVGAVEYDEQIASVYSENLGKHVLCAKVQDVDHRPFAGVDAVWASPVCTNASTANTGGEESESDLSAAEAVCRCLREVRPRFFALENVYPYRHFDAFKSICRELQALGYQWSFQHCNAADWGVAQTRKRLILRAVLGGPVPPLEATHCEGGADGGLFAENALLPWVGWYAAVEDLIPTLPESRFAQWQLARLDPEMFNSALVSGNSNANSWGDNFRSGERRAFTTTENANGRMRAFLASGAKSPHLAGVLTRGAEDPAITVTGGIAPRAFLVDGQSVIGDGRGGQVAVRNGDLPALTVPASVGKGMPRALLVNTRELHGNEGEPYTAVPSETPAYTIPGSSEASRHRAWLEQGRVVAMTPRALARFQSVPDTYLLPTKDGRVVSSLACRIIGNGVPPLLAQKVLESLLNS